MLWCVVFQLIIRVGFDFHQLMYFGVEQILRGLLPTFYDWLGDEHFLRGLLPTFCGWLGDEHFLRGLLPTNL